jgi:hypothetical protein
MTDINDLRSILLFCVNRGSLLMDEDQVECTLDDAMRKVLELVARVNITTVGDDLHNISSNLKQTAYSDVGLLHTRAANMAEWMLCANMDYSNGNTSSDGIDEGNVLGWTGHNNVIMAMLDALERTGYDIGAIQGARQARKILKETT